MVRDGRYRRSVTVGAIAICALAFAAPVGAKTPARQVLYVTNWGTDDVSTFQLADDGTLIAPAIMTDVPPGARQPLAAVESPDGDHLYVTNWGSGGISTFGIADDGALLPVAAFGTDLVNSAGIAITADGSRLHVANFNDGAAGSVSTFGVGIDGVPILLRTQDSHGLGAAGVALSPDGRTLAVANMGSGNVSIFRIAADGTANWDATRETAAGAFFPAFTPDGRYLVVANAEANSVSALAVDDASDPRVVATVPSGGKGPRGVAVDGSGTVHVAHYDHGTGPGSVASFAIGLDGQLTQLGEAVTTGANGTEAIVAHDDSLYVANFNMGGPGSVSMFALLPEGQPVLVSDPTLTGGSQPDFGSIVIHTVDTERR